VNWNEIERNERTDIGRPIKVLARIKANSLDVKGHDIRTIVYKPKPQRVTQMHGLYAHYVRVSTWLASSNGKERHVGSTATDIEWKEHGRW
jgi:hypothetical protein